MNVSRATIKIFSARTAAKVISFAGTVLFSRALGASELGAFFLFQALLGILSFPADLGIRRALEKRMSEGQHAPEDLLATGTVLKVTVFSVVAAVILLYAPSVNDYVGGDVALLLVLALGLLELSRYAVNILKGEFKVGETAVLEFLRYAGWLVFGWILINYGLESRALIYGLILGLLAMSVLGIHRISTGFGTPSFDHVVSLFDFAKYNFVSQVSGQVYAWMDVIIIGLILTQSDVGAYEVAWRITTIMTLLSAAIATTIFPNISKFDVDGEHEQIARLLKQVITPSLFVVIPGFFGTVLFSEEILGLVFGSEFTIASGALIILMVEKTIQAVHLVFGRALVATDHPGLSARATVVAISLNLVLNFTLIVPFGLVGAAVATTFSLLVDTALHIWYLSKFVKIRIPYREVGGMVGAALAMTGSLLAVRSVVAVDTLPTLVVLVLMGAATYGCVALLLTPVRTRMIEFGTGALR